MKSKEEGYVLDVLKANVMVDVIRDMNAALDLDGCLKIIIDGVCKVLNVEIGSIMLIDKEEEVLKIKASKGISEDIAKSTKIELGKEISGWVAKQGISLLIKDIEKDHEFFRKGAEKYYTKSLLSIPLKAKDEVIGVLNVNNKVDRDSFNELDLEILTLFVSHASIVIEKICLYEDKKKEAEELAILTKKLKTNKRIISKANELLDKSLYDLTIISEVSKAASSSLSLKECANAIFEVLNEIIDCLTIGMFIVNEKNQSQFIISINSPISYSYLTRLEKETIEGISKRFKDIELAYNREDLILVKDEQKELITKNIKVNLTSYYGVGISFTGNLKGLLCVGHKKIDAFTKEEIRLMEIVAMHANVAVENAILYEKIELLSITDELTGLYNYRYFSSKLDSEILRSQRYKRVFSLIIMDIDDFKLINDNYGHKQGDVVLKTLAKIMKDTTREVNILARYGGEEFTIILPEENIRGAMVVAERIRSNVEKHNFSYIEKGGHLKITISLGVSEYPANGESEDQLVRNADKALYRAKSEGKNKVCCARR
ncbi:MAG: diguanylate cyclase [bacterium]|nr:diguanylate cyclase [bacterium]